MQKYSLREIIISIIALIAISSAVYGYFNPTIKQVKGDEMYYPVPVPKPYAVVSKVTVTVEKIVVYDKSKIKEVLPIWFAVNQSQQMTAIGLVEPYRGKTECASVINTISGESFIMTKKLPVPFFGFENTVRVGGITGIGTELHANWTFVRLGNGYVTAGVSGIINGANKATAVGIGYDMEFEGF